MNNINFKQYLKSDNAKIYYWCLSLTLMWRVFLEILNQAQAYLYKQPIAFNSHALGNLARWGHWDGVWYQEIEHHGYVLHHLANGQESSAFFPAFPLTTRLIADVTRLNPILAGLILNILLTSIACFFMYKLTLTVAEKYGTKIKISKRKLGTLGVLCLLLYPASLFMSAYYVEAFLMVGFLGSIYFALTNRLLWSALFIIIATANKSSGLVLLPTVAVIIFEQWRTGKKRKPEELIKKLLIPLIGLVGIGSYMLFQLIKFHNALFWYKSQLAWRVPSKTFFLNNIYQIFYSHLFQESYYGSKYYYALYLFIMSLPFIITALGIWIAIKYKTYWPLVLGFFSLAIPLSTGTLLSLDRIEIITVPMATFIVIACVKKRSYMIGFLSVLTLSGLALVLFTLGFLRVLFAG